MFDCQRIFGTAVDEDLGGGGGIRTDQHAFQHLERHAFHHGTVHERAGVSFVGVHDKNFFRGVFRRKETPFHAGGESRAAASAQTGFLDHVHHFRRRMFTGFLERTESSVGLVFFQILGVDPSGKTGHTEFFDRGPFGRNGETSVFTQAEDRIDRSVIGFDRGIKHA